MTSKKVLPYQYLVPTLIGWLLVIFFLLFSTFTFSQVTLKVDTTHIRIGEQIQYEIATENTAKVIFPKLQLDSLGKVEVVHSLPIDTLKNRLYKKYLLTSFDSGTYQLPPQKVFIDNRSYLTDSLLISVVTVAVDTTKQKLFPIKSIYKATPKTWHDYIYYLWWVLGVLILIGLIWWLAFRSKKMLKKKAKILLSPIDEALEHFGYLDKKQLIEQQKIKEYYVELTDIIRNYIGKDVNIPTLEVTTDELITLLSIHNKSNKIGIEKERIIQLHQFLKQADLVKFAKAKPELLQIQEDRKTAEVIINDIQSVVHKPVLDEFGHEIVIETQEQIQVKTSRNRRIVGLIIGVVIALIIAISTVSYYGFTYVKDTIIGHPTKELLEGEWYKSSYGYPAISLETPKVLKAISSGVPQGAEQFMTSNASFSYGSLISGFVISVTTVEFNEQVPLELEKVIANAVNLIESQKGISDFSYDEEELSINGVNGKKLLGTFKAMDQKLLVKQFILINGNAVQQISFIRKENDNYAAKIEARIEKSIQLQKLDKPTKDKASNDN